MEEVSKNQVSKVLLPQREARVLRLFVFCSPKQNDADTARRKSSLTSSRFIFRKGKALTQVKSISSYQKTTEEACFSRFRLRLKTDSSTALYQHFRVGQQVTASLPFSLKQVLYLRHIDNSIVPAVTQFHWLSLTSKSDPASRQTSGQIFDVDYLKQEAVLMLDLFQSCYVTVPLSSLLVGPQQQAAIDGYNKQFYTDPFNSADPIHTAGVSKKLARADSTSP